MENRIERQVDSGATSKSYRSAIALGSNLGDSAKTLNRALDTLDNLPGIDVRTQSSRYETAPLGPAQPNFVNACALLDVQMTPHHLLATLLKIEDQFGRVRQEKWGPRTLDLDLLLYEDHIINSSDLTVPHAYMHERAFVLVPLAEIAPDWIDPVSKQPIAYLLAQVDQAGVVKMT